MSPIVIAFLKANTLKLWGIEFSGEQKEDNTIAAAWTSIIESKYTIVSLIYKYRRIQDSFRIRNSNDAFRKEYATCQGKNNHLRHS
jgi:hypothetical protein